MLLLDFLEIRRRTQRLWIQKVTASTITSKAEKNFDKTIKAVKEEKESVKAMLLESSTQFADNVKGRFGTRLTETIETESEKIDDL